MTKRIHSLTLAAMATLAVFPSCKSFSDWKGTDKPKTRFILQTELWRFPVEIGVGWPRTLAPGGKAPVLIPEPAAPPTDPHIWELQWWKDLMGESADSNQPDATPAATSTGSR